MEIFSNIRHTIGSLILHKRLKKLQRSKKVYNLFTARRIGILFDGTEGESFDRVMEFYKFLRLKGINTYVLGYVNARDVPDKYLFKKNFNFILRKNLNWWYLPLGEEVEKFIRESFDILIDLTLEDIFPCRFILALSPAHFKVGKLSNKNEYYDLMIKIDSGKKIDYFIEQTRHYLEMINRP